MLQQILNYNRRRLIVFCLACVLAIPSFGQTSLVSDPLDDLNNYPVQGDEKKDKKKRDEFKVYGSMNFNSLKVDAENYETTTGLGWMLGGSYKRGKFFYWELGARYNRAVFDLANPADTSSYFDRLFGVSNIDVPITFGINTLWFVSRIVNVRVFISAVPEFVIGVSESDLKIDGMLIDKDRLNSFNICGQGGVGVDVAFIFLEAGINYGFLDLMKNVKTSNPVQGFVSLGFRF
jgi:hypothetical protein